MHDRKPWYALVVARPNPEIDECANIGIIFGENGNRKLHFYKDLPRLRSIVREEEAALYGELLKSISSGLESNMELLMLEGRVGSQIKISTPRALHSAVNRSLIHWYMERYLAHPAKPEEHELIVERPRAQMGVLDRILGECVSPVLGEIEKKVTPAHLFSAKGASLFANPAIRTLDRAVRGPSKDLLIGSLQLESLGIRKILSDSALRARGFWQFNSIRADLEKFDGRRIRTLGILLNGVGGKQDKGELEDAKAFVEHLWSQEADDFVELHGGIVTTELKKIIEWTTE